MLSGYLAQFHDLPEVPEDDLLQINDPVHYDRDGAYSFDGTLLFIEEEQNKGLVKWTDCLGQTRMMLVELGYLSKGKQTAKAVKTSAVA